VSGCFSRARAYANVSYPAQGQNSAVIGCHVGGDEAEAFGVHLSKDHEAFRLMYWARPDGSTEFANIGVKQDLSICKGDLRTYAAARYC
jgi:hypothetical protein